MTSKHNNTGKVFTNVTGPKEEVTVLDVEDQGEWESRKVWRWVSKGIREGDFEVASREKTKIEVCALWSLSTFLWIYEVDESVSFV